MAVRLVVFFFLFSYFNLGCLNFLLLFSRHSIRIKITSALCLRFFFFFSSAIFRLSLALLPQPFCIYFSLFFFFLFPQTRTTATNTNIQFFVVLIVTQSFLHLLTSSSSSSSFFESKSIFAIVIFLRDRRPNIHTFKRDFIIVKF